MNSQTHGDLGRRVAALRVLRGLTQAELAGRLGVTQSAVSRLEIGLREPSVRLVAAIAKEFDVSLDDLVFGRDGWTP